MKLTESQLRQIIRRELRRKYHRRQNVLSEVRMAQVYSAPMPVQSRAHPLFAAAIKGEEWVKEAYEPEVGRAELIGGPVAAKWSQSGLTMRLLTPGGGPIQLSTQNDVQALIALLEELLAGPMRTSP